MLRSTSATWRLCIMCNPATEMTVRDLFCLILPCSDVALGLVSRATHTRGIHVRFCKEKKGSVLHTAHADDVTFDLSVISCFYICNVLNLSSRRFQPPLRARS